jgi:hypothetical protein
VKKLVKEPLLHFMALGGALFAVHSAFAPAETARTLRSGTIQISAADVARVGSLWARQWGRSPTPEELSDTLTDNIKEEVLAREARRLRLDEEDAVVRRRLAQKMAFVLDDTARLGQATEAELRELYNARPDLSHGPTRVSFEQTFFRGAEGEDRASIQLASLTAKLPTGSAGDPFLLGNVFTDEDERSLSNTFGASFSQNVIAAEPGRWSGPFRSAYGFHLVRVTSMTPPRTLPFEEVRDRLVHEWQVIKQEHAKREGYEALLRKYDFAVDPEVRPLLQPFLKARRIHQ